MMSTRAPVLSEEKAEERQRVFLWPDRTQQPTELIPNPLWSVFPKAKGKIDVGHRVGEARYRTRAEIRCVVWSGQAEAKLGSRQTRSSWVPWYGSSTTYRLSRQHQSRPAITRQMLCVAAYSRRITNEAV